MGNKVYEGGGSSQAMTSVPHSGVPAAGGSVTEMLTRFCSSPTSKGAQSVSVALSPKTSRSPRLSIRTFIAGKRRCRPRAKVSPGVPGRFRSMIIRSKVFWRNIRRVCTAVPTAVTSWPSLAKARAKSLLSGTISSTTKIRAIPFHSAPERHRSESLRRPPSGRG
jgi:hypothetical protein